MRKKDIARFNYIQQNFALQHFAGITSCDQYHTSLVITITQQLRLASRPSFKKSPILSTSRVKEVRSKVMSVFHFGRFILKFYAGSIAVLVLANALSTL
ncbi:hypothetical protein [Pseudanabaena sp. ABRG5-3]|uniref:hypothetical protein n=1 Tax=Pseudanabaena sp. ABRG5-3 TaxID=685565 RepID=UPI000F82D249|nr:hypothetical protein [Pseudanabaena sp. ABRG5-3]